MDGWEKWHVRRKKHTRIAQPLHLGAKVEMGVLRNRIILTGHPSIFHSQVDPISKWHIQPNPLMDSVTWQEHETLEDILDPSP